MEQGEIKDFTETDKIDRVRCAHAQMHTFTDPYTVKKVARHSNSNSKSMVCQCYNLGTCSQQNTLETKGVMYRHVYSFCFAKSGKNSNTLKEIVETSRNKKPSKPGCGSYTFCF